MRKKAMFDPIIQDIEPLDIGNSDLDMSIYHELKEHPRVVMVTSWKEFFREFWQPEMGDFDKAFNKFCGHWKIMNSKGFRFAGVKACTLVDGRTVAHENQYDPSGIVSEQQVGTELYPSRLRKEAEYEMHHDHSEEDARNYEYTGPWVSALMVQAKIERRERYDSTLSWIVKHADKLKKMAQERKTPYVRNLYRRFWRAYFQAQRANEKKGYGDQSKPLTIAQRMDVKREFERLAQIHEVDLVIEWPEGDGPRTIHDIIEDKKAELSVLYESADPKDFAKAEEVELELESLENKLKVDQSELTPWITEWMTGIDRETLDGDDR
jgi:hypothetical protein